MLISVIVPVYNVEKYLQRCVESIIAQTYKTIEILLIDDGSTDKSGRICDKFSLLDQRIRVFHKKMVESVVLETWGLKMLLVSTSASWIVMID